MAKKPNTAEAIDTTTEVNPVAAKTPRTRKVTITPTATETSISLVVDILGQGEPTQAVFATDISGLPAELANKLILRGITSFLHDKTAGAKDVSQVPALVEGVFEQVRAGTIFDSARQAVSNVVLPLTVQAIMVRDNLNLEDNDARQAALADWKSLSEEEKRSLRQDSLLNNICATINGKIAAKALADSGIVV